MSEHAQKCWNHQPIAHLVVGCVINTQAWWVGQRSQRKHRTTHDPCNIPSGVFCPKLGFESGVTLATSICLLVVLPLSTDQHSAFSSCDPLSWVFPFSILTPVTVRQAEEWALLSPRLALPCLCPSGCLTEQLCFCPQRSLSLELKGGGGDRFGNNFIIRQECGVSSPPSLRKGSPFRFVLMRKECQYLKLLRNNAFFPRKIDSFSRALASHSQGWAKCTEPLQPTTKDLGTRVVGAPALPMTISSAARTRIHTLISWPSGLQVLHGSTPSPTHCSLSLSTSITAFHKNFSLPGMSTCTLCSSD